MSVYCVTCTKSVHKRLPGVICTGCTRAFHFKCVNLSEEMVKNISEGSATWLCPVCRSSSNRSIIDCVEVDPPNIPENPTLHDVMVALNTVQEKLVDLERSQQFISNSIDGLNQKVSALTSENSCIKTKLKQMEIQLDQYENKLSLLEANIDIPNQTRNSCNIVVSGLPGDTSDIHELVIKTTNAIGEVISKNDITSIVKMKLNDNDKSTLKNSFIVSLKSLELKQQILTKFRKKKTLFLDEVDDSQAKIRIQLLHHFTKHQSLLYTEAKKFKIKHNFRFLWCTNNKILLRKLPETDVHHIRSSSDLHRLHRILQPANQNDDEEQILIDVQPASKKK